MKRFLSITLCVMLIFATVCCLTACKKDSVTPVYIRIVDPTGKDKYIYSGGQLVLPYTGEEYILDVEIVTVKGKIVTEGRKTITVKKWSDHSTITTLKEISTYEFKVTFNSCEYERNTISWYSSSYFMIHITIE